MRLNRGRGWGRGRGRPTRCRAKVQIGAMLLCKGAKVSDSFQATGGGWQPRVAGGGVARLLHLNPNTRIRYPMAETWDPRMLSCRPPPGAATCHPRMGSLCRDAVSTLPKAVPNR